MKKLFTLCLLLTSTFCFAQTGSVGIGTTTPNAGAALEIKSTNKALLLPRMVSANVNSIVSPAEGMTAYDLDKHRLVGYMGSVGTDVIAQTVATINTTVNTTTVVGQSFTATSTFKLQDIGVFLITPANTVTTFTMNVLSGAGGGGTNLGTTTLVVNGGISQLQNFNFFNSDITFQNGQVYTFTVIADVLNANTAYISLNQNNPYSGGILYGANAPYPALDLQFEIRTTGANGWQQVLVLNQPNQGKLIIDGGIGDAFTILNGGDVKIYDDPGTSSVLLYSGVPASPGANKGIFTVASDGKTFSFNGTGGSVSSDERLKQDIVPVNNSLQKVMRLNGYSYRFKTKATDPRKEIGVLAQEVKKVLPEAVYTDEKGMYSVSYNSLVPLLINAVKELKQKLDKTAMLQAENERLKRNQQNLAKRMQQLESLVMKQQNIPHSLSRK